ncbi:Lactate dehydrogenase [Prosthecobacter debontii]|uniref:Lactate dehydrogenase n=1 Tax=Prosthecobacter debontii TaxID=48467 RepID=A0A1T4WXJ4_9BACT|nr:2-hydroxyacid dehydrogenase [Prosthecobacter debontii]SKA82080.1 Lactate dehydrogenase [Prosthecobacter debontii]
MNSKPEILLLAPLPQFLLGPLWEACICHSYFMTEHKETLLAEAGPRIRGIVMAGGSQAPVELLKKLPALEIISVFGVGYDGVPVEYCRQRGIHVTNTPDVLTDDVADIAVGLILMTSRRLAEAERYVRAQQWPRAPFPLAHSLRGKTAGILGLGRIGKAIAERLVPHGLKIAYHGRHAQSDVSYHYCDGLKSLAEESDFLVVACPGGAGTHHLVDAEILRALGPHGTVINIARGSVVDEQALVTALNSGTIRSAGLDVFEHEPQIPAELLNDERVVLLPHIGSATQETREAMAALCVGNVNAHFSGAPLLTPV